MIWFRRKSKGLQSPHPQRRESLFADAPLAQVAQLANDDPDTPAARFHAAYASTQVGDRVHAQHQLRELLQMPGVPTRLQLQACACLRALSATLADPRGVRGVVVEIGSAAGLETFACYDDHTAVFLARNGAVVDQEVPDPTIDSLVDALLAASAPIVEHTGPHDGAREHPPEAGQACISVLTAGGTHVGTGPLPVLENDALGGPVLRAASAAMRAVYARGQAQSARQG